MAYLKTREGNSVAATAHFNRRLRMIAMFPRRPKIARASPEIYGKINSQLFEFAHASWNMGIPAFAGIPVVSSLWEISDEAEVIWLRLEGVQSVDTEFRISRATPKSSVTFVRGQPIQIASDKDVLDLAESRTRILSWSTACESLDVLRKISAGGEVRHSLYGPVYKPIYFLLPEECGIFGQILQA